MKNNLPIDIQKISTMLIEHCNEYIMPLYKNLNEAQIHKKGKNNDIVTDADENMERQLSLNLTQYLKNSQILGEETYAKSPETAENLKSDNYIWVIDPLDGTRNFINGKKEFCSMLALVKNAEVQAAWIYTPLQEQMIMAEKNCELTDQNGSVIDLKKVETIETENMVGQINFGMVGESRRANLQHLAERHYKNLDKVFCVGYDFSGLCLNQRHFSAYRYLWWWDHIPGVFLLQQAGGSIKQVGGEDYSAIKPARNLIVAVNGSVSQEIINFLDINKEVV